MTDAAGRDRLAILVHEVRSPVAALAAIAEASRDVSLEPSARRSLAGLAIAACFGIERVVTDATVTSVRSEVVDVEKLVHEIASTWALGGANVRSRNTSGLPPVEADPLRLRQALDNLVSNALAHSRPDEEVIVSALLEGAEIQVSVADVGPGIPVAEHERIFEAGVRLDVEKPGSGLGLAVARAIAEAHGGTLRVESAPGRGATFTLSLPVG